MGFRGMSVTDPDRETLDVISQILAGQSGRLFLELRDKKSLAYSVSAMSVEGLAPGAYDLAAAFVERSLGALAPGGRLAFVLPRALMTARHPIRSGARRSESTA